MPTSATEDTRPSIADRVSWPVVIVIVAGLVLFALCDLGVRRLEATHAAEVRTRLRHEIETGIFAAKKRELETVFKVQYETARTISLLPAIRRIKGGNLTSADEDIVKTGRLTAETHRVIQQLYNNLFTNVAVSEVYCIIDGFDHGKGETPFFMFDSLIVADRPEDGGGDAGARDRDEPEESEEDEYRYYPVQLRYFKERYGQLQIKELGDVPAAFSPAMRTCDNTQYPSISRADVRDTYGILYSVPFFAEGGRFRGIVSCIFRLNVLEARLIGVPFLIITDEDRRAAAAAGFTMPERPSRFVLTNPGHGIVVADRRDKALIDRVGQGAPQESPHLIVATLETTGDSPWQLSYHVDERRYLQLEQREGGVYLLIRWLLGVGVLALVVLALYRRRLRTTRDRIAGLAESIRALAEGQRDLSARLDPSRLPAEVRGVADRVNRFAARAESLVTRAQSTAHELTQTSETLLGSAQEQQARATEQAASVEEIKETLGALLSSAAGIEEVGESVLGNAQVTERNSTLIAERIGELANHTHRIEAILLQIKGIASKSDLLALNAALEGTRAGEAGRGFSLVASQMQRLAEQVIDAVKAIEALTADITTSTQGAVMASEEATRLTTATTTSADQIRYAVQQQQQGTREVVQAIEDIAQVARDNVREAARILDISSTLSTLSAELQDPLQKAAP